MKILVIGGSNFIGWRLLNKLSQNDYGEITVVNRGNRDREYPRGVKHIIADRSDLKSMHKVVDDTFFDVVFDMCAFKQYQAEEMVSLFSNRVGRYVFISSAAAYLDNQILPLTENSCCGYHPQWGAYGSAKYDCERVFMDAHKSINFPVTIIRPSYVYGEGNTIDRETLLFDRIYKEMPIFIPNSGYGVIQLGHVDDLCDALETLINTNKGIGEVYNVSGEEYITLNGLVDIISQIVKKNVTTIPVQPEALGFTQRQIFPFENNTYFTSIEKFKSTFNWAPKVTLIDGLTNAFEIWKSGRSPIKTNYDNEKKLLEIINN